MHIYVLVISLFLCTLEIAAAEQIPQLPQNFLSDADKATLIHDGKILKTHTKKPFRPVFTPPFSLAQQFASTWQQEEPTCLIEMLYLHAKTEKTGKDIQKISRILRSPSRLKGLEYYSESRKKMRLLYEDSYIIDNPVNKNRQPDATLRADNDFLVYVLQKDLSFGTNIYQTRFISDKNSSGFSFMNLNPVKYGIFTVINEQNLLSSVSVIDLGDNILIHGITRCNCGSIGILRYKIEKSIRTRMEAVCNWFINRYDSAEQETPVVSEE